MLFSIKLHVRVMFVRYLCLFVGLKGFGLRRLLSKSSVSSTQHLKCRLVTLLCDQTGDINNPARIHKKRRRKRRLISV